MTTEVVGDDPVIFECGKRKADGVCPSQTHCNEFGYCIAGAPTTVSDDPVIFECGKRKADGVCPSETHCNEFGYCIAGAPMTEVVEEDPEIFECGKRKLDGVCPSETHCNEFGYCIAGNGLETEFIEVSVLAKYKEACKVSSDCVDSSVSFPLCCPTGTCLQCTSESSFFGKMKNFFNKNH